MSNIKVRFRALPNLLVASFLLINQAKAEPSKPFKIAIAYPPSESDSVSIGDECICMSKGVFKNLENSGVTIAAEVVSFGRTPLKIAESAKHIRAHNFDAVVGPLISSETIVMAKELRKAAIPVFSPTATHPDVTKGNPHVVRMAFSDLYQARKLALYTVNEHQPKRVSIVVNRSRPYSDFLSGEYTRQLRQLNEKIQITTFDIIEGFDEFSELAKKLIVSEPDMVFLPLVSADVAKFYKELAKTNKSFTILGGDSIGGRPEFIRIMGKTTPRIKLVFVKHWDEDHTRIAGSRYGKVHKTYCNKMRHSMMTVTCFEAAQILADTLHANPSLRGVVLAKGARARGFKGLTGSTKFAEGETHKQLKLFIIENNAAKFWKIYD